MPRVEIDLPNKWLFEMCQHAQVQDLNYGGHMSNDAFLRLAHESRIRCLKQFGFSEMDAGGFGLIMADAEVRFLKEVFHGELLRVQVGISSFSRTSIDMVYCVAHGETQVAHIKTGMVFYDYEKRKVARMPDIFYAKILAPL